MASGLHDWVDDYEALTGSVGLVDLSTRDQVELRGDDRYKFLHNFCTNEIKKLAPGAGCEAMVLDVKGHVLAHGFVFSGPESLVIETVPDEGAKVAKHLDRYLIREKVEIIDRSADWAELLLSGPQAPALLHELTSQAPPETLLSSVEARIATAEVWLRRVDWTGVAFLIDCRRSDLASIQEQLTKAGAKPCAHAAFEAARIEAGLPFYGPDITEKNLPQELDRNLQAINFNKGCYLGQETVARIDALGHVNRTLVGVRFSDQDLPGPGIELLAGEQVVGQVTSAAFSPRLQSPLALAYVRRGHNEPGKELSSTLGPAVVVKLPITGG